MSTFHDEGTIDIGRFLKAKARECRIAHCGHPACLRRLEKRLRGPSERELVSRLPRFLQASFPPVSKPLPVQPMSAIDVGGTSKDQLREARVVRSLGIKRRNGKKSRRGPVSRVLDGLLGGCM